jgi:Bifunctional DNA primase/polymerase, N-terminal
MSKIKTKLHIVAFPLRSKSDPLEIALDLMRRGIKPVPVPGDKNPTLNKWQKIEITADNVARRFRSKTINVGAHWGPQSGGLRDVDLDCPEAVRLAPYFLPPTSLIYGRPSKRRSHYIYRGADDPAEKSVIQLRDEKKAVIVELRLGSGGKGAMSVMPGSVHTSGELYEWDVDGEAGAGENALLKSAIAKIAVGTILIRHWPEKSRHDASLCVGGFLARAGWPVDDISHFMVAVQQEAGVEDPSHVDGRKAAVDAAERHGRGENTYGLPMMIEFFGKAAAKQMAKIIGYGEAADGRPVIKVKPGELSVTATKGEEVLIASGVQFFERSNMLVRPTVRKVHTFKRKQTSVAQLIRVEQVYMRDVLGRVASWRKYDVRSEEWRPADPPENVASTILARAGEWKFPTIAGVISCPTMRPDGTILCEPGYDPATQLFLVDPPKMPAIPEDPTRKDAIAALALIDGLLVEFPFTDDPSKSVGLSTIITPVVRGACSVVPLHAVIAPVAGSGKSYLLDIAAAISIGDKMPVLGISEDDSKAELEKRLGAAVIAGQPLITVDNVMGELGGAALCQIVERPRPQVRILGKSELVEMEARTSVFANGNNMVVVGELCRRVIRANLDPNMANPYLRQSRREGSVWWVEVCGT